MNGEVSTKTLTGKIKTGQKLSGKIAKAFSTIGKSSSNSLTGKLETSPRIDGETTSTSDLTGNIATVYQVNAPYYEGDYEVTPAVTAQELKTKHKHMTDNLTINAIPYAEVTNSANGKTVTIGG